jgi:hypothetical protein
LGISNEAEEFTILSGMTSALALLLAAQTLEGREITLAYRQGVFLVGQGTAVEAVPVRAPEPPKPTHVMFRRGTSYAVWDKRGLTLRTGKRTRTTRMPEVAVSPRSLRVPRYSRPSNSVKAGTRTKNASTLSGARRIGSVVYFLLRWTDKSSGAPWLEALLHVDLSQKNPKPSLMGRFEGLSTATLPVDDQLFVLKGQLAAVTRRDATWGLSTFDAERRAFEWQPYGARLAGFLPVGARGGLFVERTDWGTTAGGRVDFAGKVRRDLFEGRGPLRFLDTITPPLALMGTPALAIASQRRDRCCAPAARLRRHPPHPARHLGLVPRHRPHLGRPV